MTKPNRDREFKCRADNRTYDLGVNPLNQCSNQSVSKHYLIDSCREVGLVGDGQQWELRVTSRDYKTNKVFVMESHGHMTPTHYAEITRIGI